MKSNKNRKEEVIKTENPPKNKWVDIVDLGAMLDPCDTHINIFKVTFDVIYFVAITFYQ